MKRLFSIFAIIVGFVAFTHFSQANAQTSYKIQSKAPYISQSLKPIIAKYRREDYSGAMVDLENLLKVEKNNTAAKYYLALCYTQLGYKQEATDVYNEIVKLNDNMTLVYYSKKALACVDNMGSDECRAATTGVSKDKQGAVAEEEDDITKFIKSGQKIHPSAMDRIIQERMERKIKTEEAAKAGQQNSNLHSAIPSNEEIASALSTLAKVGINPYSQNNTGMLSLLQSPYQGQVPNPYLMMQYGNNNSDLAKLMLYTQLNSQANQFYGL